MSVVLYEGVVATPRIVDLRGRRSVQGAAITLPIACCQTSLSMRMRSSPMMAFGNGSGPIPNNPIAPRSRTAGANLHRVKACCIAFFSLMRTRRRCDTQSPSRLNARTLNATVSSGNAESARLEGVGEERKMIEAAKNLNLVRF